MCRSPPAWSPRPDPLPAHARRQRRLDIGMATGEGAFRDVEAEEGKKGVVRPLCVSRQRFCTRETISKALGAGGGRMYLIHAAIPTRRGCKCTVHSPKPRPGGPPNLHPGEEARMNAPHM